MENLSSDDEADEMSEGSDLQQFSDDEFSSDTDSDDNDNLTQETESSIEADSQQTDAQDAEFWSYDLHPVNVAPFTESVGPEHTSLPDDDVLKYFFCMISEEFFEIVAQETNRYAEQEMARRGSRDPVWHPTTEAEIRAFFGLNIIMGINQMPRLDMYWSENPLIGKLYCAMSVTDPRISEREGGLPYYSWGLGIV